ncbi:MAG: hypothetical protein R3E47_11875 [Paracoccaceae bacterium]
MVASNTYGVIYLGTVADLDPTEGNPVAENANTILNTTFGSSVDPLWSHVGTMSPVGSPGDYYRTNNNPTPISSPSTAAPPRPSIRSASIPPP